MAGHQEGGSTGRLRASPFRTIFKTASGRSRTKRVFLPQPIYLVNPLCERHNGCNNAHARKALSTDYRTSSGKTFSDHLVWERRMTFDTLSLPEPVRKGIEAAGFIQCRSEERRVGKECRSRWSPY